MRVAASVVYPGGTRRGDTLEGLYFDIADGAMYRYDSRNDRFELIDEEQITAATA